MSKKTSDNSITSLSQDWANDTANGLPFSGKAVQDFIKAQFGSKVGCWCWSTSPDASNFYHLWGFATEEDKTAYLADPDGSAALLIVNEALPISTVQGDSYGAYLWTDVSTSNEFIVNGSSMKINLRFAAVRASNGDRINLGSAGTLIVQRKTASTDWTTVATKTDILPSTDYADTTNYASVELGDCLTNGTQQLRVRATASYVDDNGDTKSVTTTYVTIGSSITKTNISLVCQQNWQTPIYASAQKDKGFPVSYMVYGAVKKTLHVEITGGNNKVLSLEYALTADQDSATITKNVSDSTDTYKLWKHGVRTVKAWLTADDGQGGTITSDVLVNRFMVVNPETDADKTTPYLMIQNLVSTCDNYAQADLCQYAVFSPSDDATANKGEDVTAIFYLTDYAETFPDDNPTQYFRIEAVVSPGTQNTLNTTVEIESENAEQTTIPAYFRVWRKDADGNEVNFMQASMGVANAVISVDNSESYSPKAGADFVLNPKTRNNSESNPCTIINAKTGEEVASTWTGFGLIKDGWLASDEDGQRVLRVPAGAKINFQYNPFAQFLQAADSALEIELDFKTRNVTNEDDPIISLFEEFTSTGSDGQTVTTFRGLKIQPLGGEVHTKSQAVSDETNFKWREGVRTHVAINIHNAVAPNKGDALIPTASTYDTSATKIALVRVFVNGDIEREFKYSITDSEEFCTGAMSNGGFTIGQDGADIDIYGIRIYQNNALEASDVLNNYISTLPTTAEKQEIRSENDILEGGKISLEKCRTKGLRCLVWHGVEPYKENTSATTGYWEIFQYDSAGNYMPEYSGTICKASAALPTKRQGSTANTYYYSNIQTKFSDVKATIDVKLSALHESISAEMKETTGEDGTVTKTVALKGGCLGKNFPVKETAVEYPYIEIDGEAGVTVPDGWVDANGKYHGQCYQLNANVPYFQKGVNKINYASSMQSHLPGVNNLYNDLHTKIVGKNGMQQGYDKARVSKYTEPFMFFTQALDSDTPVFRGPCTWGAGKMDKPTWGYAKKLHPMFAMFEGSDNNYDLTDMRVPFTWGKTACSENITYSPDDEGYFYNGMQCLDFDGGATDEAEDGSETPKAVLTARLQEVWNFLYLHAPMIEYYKGTFDKFQASDDAKKTSRKFWCTDGDDAYLLKRYNFVDKKWVDAGLWDDTTNAFAKIDLRTDEMTVDTYNNSENQAEYKALNEELKGAIVAHAKKYIGWYFKEASLKLYYTLVIHMLCGTDNCSKNTYFVIDPVAKDVTIDGTTKSCYLMELHTDDVDTMLAIDNNGRTTKPYYIDRQHPYVDGDATTNKYEGANNVLFNLCELMWEDTKELQSMAKTIMTTMEGMVSETDTIPGIPSDVAKVSVYGCLWKYIYFIQAYFPQVAFNEAARIRYEFPEMIGFVSYGSGARGVRPITQSNGALLQCELQFIERRLVLMASYAAWGPFNDGKTGNLGISDATEGFSIQAFHTPDVDQSLNDYEFTVTPHQYLYPTGIMGQTSIDPHVRVAPGESYVLSLGTTSSNDTGMSINGINFYRSIGNIGDLSTTPKNTLTVKGNRLTEFIAEPSKTYTDKDTGVVMPAFRPGAFDVTAKNIVKFSVKGCSQTSGSIDLSAESRLKEVDASETKLSEVTLPTCNTLTSVHLPDTVSVVNITGQPNLATLKIDGYSNMTKYVVKGNTLIDTYPHVTGMYKAGAQLKTLTIEGIAWGTENRITADMMMWMAGVPATLTGSITLVAAKTDRYLNINDKITLGKLYGNIDSTDNALYISYTILKINTVSISGHNTIYMREADKDYTLEVAPSPANGNNIAVDENGIKLKWAIDSSADEYAHWVDDQTGILYVDKLSDAKREQKHTVTLTAGTTTGSTLTAEKKVGFYRHIPVVGDFAYADGTFDGEWDETRDFVGLVFMRLPITDESGQVTGYDVRVVSKEFLILTSTNGASQWSLHRWGIWSRDDSTGWGSEKTNIATAAGVNDPGDISDLTNYMIADKNATFTIDDSSYLDDTQPDGYKVLTTGAIMNYDGPSNTAKILAHAKKIVNGYLKESYPTTMTELADAMQTLKNNNSSVTNNYRYEEFYYPAAWGCVFYEPSAKGTVGDAFKKGQWYLPAVGELCRICNFYRQGETADKANFEAASEAVTPIIANAASKAGKSVMEVWKEWLWSSNETTENSCAFYITSNQILWNLNYGRKSNQLHVRPCCSVTFNL